MYKVMVAGDVMFRNAIESSSAFKKFSSRIDLSKTSNKAETISLLKKNMFDLLILDIESIADHEMSLLKTCKKERLCSRTIIVDNALDFTKTRQAFVLGAFDYLLKPIDEETFSDVLKRCLTSMEKGNRLSFIEQSIITAISNGDTQNLQKELPVLFDYATRYYEENIIDIGHALLTASAHTYSVIQLRFPWIENFIEDYDLYKAKILSGQTLPSLFSTFENFLFEMLDIINLLYYISNNKMIKKICKYTLEKCDEKITLSYVAQNCFLNKTYLSHTFKQETGISFVDYVTLIKILRAKKLLKESDLKIFEISSMLGFSDTGYFSKKFKKTQGITPIEYKETLRCS